MTVAGSNPACDFLISFFSNNFHDFYEIKQMSMNLMIMNLHNENTPMQYTAIFHGCKNVHFQTKIFNIFLIFAQNIDCGYTLEPPQ